MKNGRTNKQPDDAPFDMSSDACKRRLKQRGRKPANGMGDDEPFDIAARHERKLRARPKIEFGIDEE